MDLDPDIIERLRAAGCVYAEDEARLLAQAATSPSHLGSLLRRRCGGEPLEYVLGWAGFCGLRVLVRPGVFVPRRRSEFLAACAVELAREAHRRPPRVLDMCCGSGALALVVAREVPGARLCAVDHSAEAVACARDNLAGHDCDVLLGDMFRALEGGRPRDFDVIVANVPYVPTAEIATLPAEARCFEPLSTLDGGIDGLDMQRRLIDGARGWLHEGGCVVVETSRRQMRETERLASERGFRVELRLLDAPEATVAILRPR